MHQLEIRLLGGFDARFGEASATAFESQKARALVAYLALHPEQPQEREKLAGLLWGDRSPQSARRNLRQALHSVRLALEHQGESAVAATHQVVQLNPGIDCWVDVVAFEQAIEKGLSERGPDPHYLATAARLYVGDLLAGFYVRDSPPFEEWLLTEQERLREQAMEVLRALISAYLGRGEYRLGIQYARRLLSIDPLSEEAQRQLMRLYSLAGRRGRALAQYENLRNQLTRELGVEPLEETTELYRSILLEELPQSPQEATEEPIGPLIPLVGRNRAFAHLEDRWAEVLAGRGGWTIIDGEAGVGKSRLAKSFVDRATSQRQAIVLAGRAYSTSPPVGYQVFAELLVGAFADILPDEIQIQSRLSARTLSRFLLVAPELRELAAGSGGEPAPARSTDPERLAEAFCEFLDTVAGWSTPGQALPLILFLDELQWADRASLELIGRLEAWVSERPIWILSTMRSGQIRAPVKPDALGERVDRLTLGRLGSSEVEELAGSMVGPSDATRLASFLGRHSGGLPLAIAELVNLLWDQGDLKASAPGQWRLEGDPGRRIESPSSVSELVQRRLLGLPASARRLLAMAGVIGHQFDAETLRVAANENMRVVEICIELMLERWLIRQFPRSWSPAGRKPDLVLWARGARRGWFEFAHAAIRASAMEHINPLRRRLMHRDLANALRQARGENVEEICETVAFHEVAAGEWERALPLLEAATARAEAIGAREVADWYRGRALEAVDRLLKDRRQEGDDKRLRSIRRRLGKS